MDGDIFNHISLECNPSGILIWTPAAEIMQEQAA